MCDSACRVRRTGPTPWFFVVAAALASAALAPGSLSAQTAPEPVLDQLRRTFQQPGLTLGLLLQAVVDPGIDGEPARTQVAAARVRVSGTLDSGFRYDLQTNFAASPSLLDGRVGWSSGRAFAVDAGRFKAPFSRELLTYAGSIDFVDRSRVVSALAPNRQLGVQLSGSVHENVSWAAGAFTGGSNSSAGEPLVGVFRLEGTNLVVGEGTLSVAGHAAVGQDGGVGQGVGGTGFRGDGVLFGVDGRFESGVLLLAAEYIRADWSPSFGADGDAEGLYATAGVRVADDHQLLVRWDRYRSVVAGVPDDALVLGYNVWPTSASEIQVNALIPMRDSGEPYRIVVNFQIGF